MKSILKQKTALYSIIIGISALFGTTTCMLIPHKSKKAIKKQIENIQATFRKKKLSDQLNSKTLLIDNIPYRSRKLADKILKITETRSSQPETSAIFLENAPFNLPELPKVLLFKIFAEISPTYKNKLQKTCSFFYENGSNQPPYIWNLIDYPLNIADKDLSDIVLKTVVYEKDNALEKILQNHTKRDFVYEYLDSIKKEKVNSVLFSEHQIEKVVKKNLSFDIHQAAATMAISDILVKYNCTFLQNSPQKTKIKLTPLITASFMQDEEMLRNILYFHNNFSENEISTVLEHIGKINNQKLNNIVATKFPIAHTIYKQNQTIHEKDNMIEALIKKCWELRTEKEALQKQLSLSQRELSNTEYELRKTKNDLSNAKYERRMDSYGSSYASYPIYPTYYPTYY
ncbi:MAG TPA: hypothetical protein VKU36_02725 [Candidatus Babeliales bacterium]|nr:hypothetical protein [Candidatus Babeliales bacterium]